jgi:branched-chain amino acid transport system substrate-binding protein
MRPEKSKLVCVLVAFLILLAGCASERGQDSIKIGVITALTGFEAEQGQKLKDGLVLGVEALNYRGGVNGRPVELVIEDSKTDVNEALKAYEHIKALHSPDFMIVHNSDICMALSPRANEDQIIMFGVAAATEYKSELDFTFRLVHSAEKVGSDLAKAVQTLGHEQVAVIYTQVGFGVSLKDEFLKNFNGSVAAVEGISPNSLSFKPLLLKLSEKGTPAIVLTTVSHHAGLIAKQAGELGLGTELICSNMCNAPAFFTNAGDGSEGVVYLKDIVKEDTPFYKAYLAKHKEQPLYVMQIGFDAVQIIGDLLRICDNKQCMLDRLYSEEFQGTSHPLAFDNYGDINQEYVLVRLKKQGTDLVE